MNVIANEPIQVRNVKVEKQGVSVVLVPQAAKDETMLYQLASGELSLSDVTITPELEEIDGHVKGRGYRHGLKLSAVVAPKPPKVKPRKAAQAKPASTEE